MFITSTEIPYGLTILRNNDISDTWRQIIRKQLSDAALAAYIHYGHRLYRYW